MAAQVYEDIKEVDLQLLEARPLVPKGEHVNSYPFPFLELTPQTQTVQLPIVYLENERLKVGFAPTLGGRVVYFEETRTGLVHIDIATATRIVEDEGRGVRMAAGISWRAQGWRHTELGPVDYQAVEPSDEGDPAGIWMHELVADSPLSIHMGFLLRPGENRLRFEMRLFNRAFRTAETSPRLVFPPMDKEASGPEAHGLYDLKRDRGFAIHFEADHGRGMSTCFSEFSVVCRFAASSGALRARQVDTWVGAILPISGLGGLDAISRHAALAVTPEAMTVYYTEAQKDAKAVIRAKGKTLEAKAVGDPNIPIPFPLGGQTPERILVMNEHRQDIVRWTAGGGARVGVEAPRKDFGFERYVGELAEQILAGKGDDRALYSVSEELGVRSACFSLLGITALREGRYSDALGHFEQSLLFNAEDHLTWLGKAMASRLTEVSDEESRDLLNAHLLAPLEPALLAEAFLGQPAGVDGTSLVKRLANDTDSVTEIACILYEWRQYESLAHWVGAVLQHRDVPNLRYYLAAALIDSSVMEGEAANEVRLAQEKPINPPYPWRQTEGRILKLLSERFPKDARLAELLALYEWGSAAAIASRSSRRSS
jgi:hypothetical protein